MAFITIFKQLQAEKGLNDKQFAQDANIPYSTVRGWTYLSRLPDYNAITKIADYFEVTTDYLLGRSNDIGIVQSNANLTDTESKVLSALRQLPVKDQQRMLVVIQALNDKQ